MFYWLFVKSCRNLIADVSKDAAHLPVQFGLVDAKPFRQIRRESTVQFADRIASNVADGVLSASNMLSNAREGVSGALFLDVLEAPLGHAPGCVNAL